MSFFKVFHNRNIMIGLSLGCSVAFTVTYVPNTLLIRRYANYYQKYNEDNMPVMTSLNLKSVFEEVVTDLKLNSLEEKLIYIFISDTMDVFRGGFTKSRYGIHIGVPEYFDCDTPEEITKLKIDIDGKPVDWQSEEGKKLMDSMLLSTNAKKYVLAKNIKILDNYNLLIDSLLPFPLSFLLFNTSAKAHSYFKLSKKPIAASIYVHGLICAFYYIVGVLLHDNIKMIYEKVADDKVYEINKDYIAGSVEYHTKIIARNKALRKIMKKGEKYYTVGGNENYWFRQKGILTTYKLAYAEAVLKKEYNEESKYVIPKPRTAHA